MESRGVQTFRNASLLFLRQILARSRAITLQEPEQRAQVGWHSDSILSGLETVAKSTTGQQPRAIHSTTHLQRVREGCAGSAALRRRKLSSLARASSKLLGERAPTAIAEQQDCSAALAGHAAARNAARRRSERVKRRGRSPTSSRPRSLRDAAARAAHKTSPSPTLVNTGHLATGPPVYK